MVKHAIYRMTTNDTINATGTHGIQSLYNDTLLAKISTDLLERDSEVVGIHGAKLVARVQSKENYIENFSATLIAFVCDGTVTDYFPVSTSGLERIDFLIDQFCTAGDISFDVIDSKMSAPIKAGGADTSWIHQATFVVDVTKYLKAWARLKDDPLTNLDIDVGFAIAVQGSNSQPFYFTTHLHVKYQRHDRPIRNLLRNKL